MDEFLERQKTLKVTPEEIENMNRLIQQCVVVKSSD